MNVHQKKLNSKVFADVLQIEDTVVEILYCDNPLLLGEILVQAQTGDRPASRIMNIRTNGITAGQTYERGGLFSYRDVQTKVMMLVAEYMPYTCARLLLDILEV